MTRLTTPAHAIWKYNNDYVDANDPWRHSKWLSFLEKRLRLAKRLLRPEGSALIVTIDEKEYLRLGLLLEQVFGGATIQMITSVIKPEGTGRVNEFSRTNEFIFFVSIGEAQISPSIDNMYDRDGSQGGEMVEWRDLRRRERTSVRGSRPNQFYPVFVDGVTGRIHSVGDPLPDNVRRDSVKPPRGTKAVFPLTPQGKEMVWSKHPSTFRDLVADGHARVSGATIQYLTSGTVAAIERGDVIVTGRDEQGAVIAEFPAARAVMPKTVWTRDSHNPQTFGTKLLSALLPGRNFPFPKSLYAVEDTIRFFAKAKPNAVVLDFFGGSGTTTHAVARLNRQDNGRRQSIVVTNNEVSNAEAESLRQKGLYPGDPQWEAIGIFEHITRPRIVAAITGRTPEQEPIPGDYKYADEFPIADGFEENVEFFRLEFLDPDHVARGDAFAAILPILWMMAGSQGSREDSKGSQPWFIPKHSPFAVLTKEKEFRAFREELADRKDIKWIFLVTDSEENFGLMRRGFGRKFDCVQLYKSYLEHFRLNTPEALGQGGAA